jgi:hypothetical protein
MGHEVFTPTHAGVGERARKLDENVTLETHIRDVAGCSRPRKSATLFSSAIFMAAW